ncbi:MAG: YabP/YqfC family sporulation protein [Ruminococcus sp.]|nr:YabP/YqfC family sporulation protein [Ruminococcus sp.]
MKTRSPAFSFIGRVGELTSVGSFVGINGNQSVLIENCKAVLECNINEARAVSGRFEITVRGRDLELSDYKAHSVEVRGVIESVAVASIRRRERSALR